VVRLIIDAGAAIRARTRDTRRVAHTDAVQVNEDFGDECRVYVIGRRSSLNVSRYRDFLRRNRVASRWVDIDRDPLVALLGVQQLGARQLPLFLFADGTVLETPVPDRPTLFTEMRSELAERVGLHVRPSKEEYDLLIVGAGPAGLTAAVYAASEGLDTVVVERHAPGGQAGTSSRIENFPGFPHGVSGRELAEAIYAQALRFGAELVVGADMVEARRESDGKIGITLVSGARVRARAAIGAPGVHYRRLDAPGVERLIGSGVYYGSAVGEAAFHRGGDVFIVGGANSAGQAALHLAQYAASVTLLVRGASLEERMSRYLIERLQAHPSISVRTRSTLIGAIGERRLEQLVIAGEAAGGERTVRADALFIMIGGIPVSERVEGWLRRDEHGFMVTGTDVLEGDGQRRWWPLDREPYLLEGSQPGVFIVGDARRGSVKRVASAVGEAAIAVQLVHRYLATTPNPASSSTPAAMSDRGPPRRTRG